MLVVFGYINKHPNSSEVSMKTASQLSVTTQLIGTCHLWRRTALSNQVLLLQKDTVSVAGFTTT
jgi:hypothetical protein